MFNFLVFSHPTCRDCGMPKLYLSRYLLHRRPFLIVVSARTLYIGVRVYKYTLAWSLDQVSNVIWAWGIYMGHHWGVSPVLFIQVPKPKVVIAASMYRSVLNARPSSLLRQNHHCWENRKRSKEARERSYLWNYYKNTHSSDIPSLRKLTD